MQTLYITVRTYTNACTFLSGLLLKIPAGGVYNVIEAKCSKIAFILKMDGGRGREEGGGRGGRGREGEGGRRKRGERREGRRMRGGGGRGGKGRETGRERREGRGKRGGGGRAGKGRERGETGREGDREWGGNKYDQEASARYLWQSTHYFQHFKMAKHISHMHLHIHVLGNKLRLYVQWASCQVYASPTWLAQLCACMSINDNPDCDGQVHVHTYIRTSHENRSLIQSLALMCSAIIRFLGTTPYYQ